MTPVPTEILEGPPEVVTGLSNESVSTGQQFVLSCKINATPKGTAAWYKDDERVT